MSSQPSNRKPVERVKLGSTPVEPPRAAVFVQRVNVEDNHESKPSLFVRLKSMVIKNSGNERTVSINTVEVESPTDEDFTKIARALSHNDFPIQLGDEEDSAEVELDRTENPKHPAP
ncbi:MAG TPA: hypothetical protein VD770_00525 [Coxiellaceae bacterium]|nr:hypothetical protein [Coxiellaceae bacterium]